MKGWLCWPTGMLTTCSSSPSFSPPPLTTCLYPFGTENSASGTSRRMTIRVNDGRPQSGSAKRCMIAEERKLGRYQVSVDP
ncbi:uncharacterized protein SCHCODRAFT_02107813 [Schizophyllum commune H4-8]|uniref:uncharacterized protein n=1 Tax=Schizophyllum commune (strain H4-8 / FGSC 9210) TaxID=578458 RepID=UPI0021606915|nr:uncharacterized protein SCHCODRAFT_02107813 [Schizophyllum commune H4-8]KAI5885905.1 hypothetical protein SCHCODRAFT_02107813 [Schizophyllum commune H4-8]